MKFISMRQHLDTKHNPNSHENIKRRYNAHLEQYIQEKGPINGKFPVINKIPLYIPCKEHHYLWEIDLYGQGYERCANCEKTRLKIERPFKKKKNMTLL